ncbi:hypothetical protein [Brevibacterium litoralis]|uniref:hypothetical protein n=1 Tax=Brevibacterium litoralis TaxID=3138935 RepID=UPI0032ECDBF9
MSTVDPRTLALAEEEFLAAQEAAGVTMKVLHDTQACADASLLLDEVWNVGGAGTTQMEPGLLVALVHAGNYVGGAYDDETGDLIGVTVGFFGEPLGKMMHSHIAGVRHDQVGRGTGAAMKLHQRQWCLERGIQQMTWTFDPLIARNAYFNFHRLGANCLEYLEDFYGLMRDGVNEGQGSDRMLVSWRLDRPARVEPIAETTEGADFALRVSAEGEPVVAEVPRSASVVAVDFPTDIETLRGDDAALAARWRGALREALTGLIADGWEIRSCLRGGTYLLTHPQEEDGD